jgi:hypothetical protein
MHVGGVAFEEFHGSEGGKVSHAFGFEGVAVVAFDGSAHEPIFKAAGVILLWFDDLADELYAFEAFGGEVVDVDGA